MFYRWDICLLQEFKQNKNYMIQDPLANKTVFCFRHKNEKVTHICNQLHCLNNPLLCRQCFMENVHIHHHSNHQSHIEPFVESIMKLSDTLKNHLSPLKKVFKNTLGKSEFSGIFQHIEKGSIMFDELEDRINNIKSQVQIQLDLLVKQFQKIVLLEKQEYFKILDNYQKAFMKNIDFLRNQTEAIIDYQQTLKYYSNTNNFFLKTISEIQKKSDWLLKSKKIMMNANKILDNTHYINQTVNILTVASKIRLDLLPTWKGEENIDKGGELRYLLKRSLNQWVYVPEIRSIYEEVGNGKTYYTHNSFK